MKAKALLKGETLPDLDLLICLSEGNDCLVLTFDESQTKISNYLKDVRVRVEFVGA